MRSIATIPGRTCSLYRVRKKYLGLGILETGNGFSCDRTREEHACDGRRHATYNAEESVPFSPPEAVFSGVRIAESDHSPYPAGLGLIASCRRRVQAGGGRGVGGGGGVASMRRHVSLSSVCLYDARGAKEDDDVQCRSDCVPAAVPPSTPLQMRCVPSCDVGDA